MRNSTSSLLKKILASGSCATLVLLGVLPASAHGSDRTTARSAAPTRATAPVRVQRVAPVPRYAAPVRLQHYAAPVRVQHYAAPVRVQHYAAPVRVQHYAAPVRVQHRVAPAPFVQRMAPEGVLRHAAPAAAPFVQYVRNAPRVQREAITRGTIANSPLVRAVYNSRTRAIPVVYHPRYIAGRVVRVRSNEIVVDPVAGAPVIVQSVAAIPAIPVGSVVTLPVVYSSGIYQMYVPQQTAYTYGTTYPQYGYAYAPPMYCNGNNSSTLYAALLPALVSALSGNGNSFNSSDLASLALTAAASGNGSCQTYAPAYYSQPAYYTQPAYDAPQALTYTVAQPVPAYYNGVQYAPTAYDNCMWSDEDGDGQDCAAAPDAYGYNSYGTMYGAYTPQQVQGVVVGRSGDMLMVLGANGNPTFVYDAPALQSGFSNGPVQPGSIIDAYGYYSGSTFVATALV